MNISMKESAIRNYVASIDFNGDWSMKQISSDMRKLLGEEPSFDVIYKKDVKINEIIGKAEEIHKVERVSIVFTDLDDKFKKIEFLID